MLSSTARGYDRQWRKARAAYLQNHPLCEACKAQGRVRAANVVDHIKPHKGNRTLFWDYMNWQSLCKTCHDNKTAIEITSIVHQGAVRPEWLPKPACKVELVCGPPGSGKSWYVEERKRPNDIVIDLDVIASELSGCPIYKAGREWLGRALYERNRRIASLAGHRNITAWVVISAASPTLRAWWQAKLAATQVTLLDVNADECKRRILADHRRPRDIQLNHIVAVDNWWAIERGNKRSYVSSACDVHGMPLDPIHHWRQHP